MQTLQLSAPSQPDSSLTPSLPTSHSVAVWASTNAPAVLAILRKANACKTSNFDLITEEGWTMLVADIAEDFPYLTLAELNGIIKLGYKGQLDKYKSLPLNYTRIYQWVASEAPKQSSAWRAKFPEVFAWAAILDLDSILLTKLIERAKVAGISGLNDSLARTELREIISYRPVRGPGEPRWVNEVTKGQLDARMLELEEIYPEYARRHAASLY